MSRFPLLTPPGEQPFVYVEVAPGSVVAVANVHLPSSRYGPFKIRDGASAEEVLDVEEHKRVAALAPALEAVEGLAARRRSRLPDRRLQRAVAPGLDRRGRRDPRPRPVPARVARERGGGGGGPRRLLPRGEPGSRRGPGPDLAGEPAVRPGLQPVPGTARRPTGSTSSTPAARSRRSRASSSARRAARASTSPSRPWPTDHRATVSTFEVEPAPAPTIVSVDQRLVTVGEDVAVRFHAADGRGGGRVRPGRGGPPRTRRIEYLARRGASVRRSPTARPCGPGSYEAVLLAASGDGARPRAVLGAGGRRRAARSGRRARRTRSASRSRSRGASRRGTAGTGSACTGAAPTPNRASYLLVGPHGRNRRGIRRLRRRFARRLAAGAGRVHRLPAAGRQLRGARGRRLPHRVTRDHSMRSSISHAWSSTCHAERRTK